MDLKQGWQKWMALSRVAGNFLARILVSIFYFTVMLPFSLSVTLFGDPLGLKEQSSSDHWLPRQAKPDSLTESARQF